MTNVTMTPNKDKIDQNFRNNYLKYHDFTPVINQKENLTYKSVLNKLSFIIPTVNNLPKHYCESCFL